MESIFDFYSADPEIADCKITPALEKEKWVSIAMSSEYFHMNLLDIWYPFLTRSIKKNLISAFTVEFSSPEPDVLMVLLRTNQVCFVNFLKKEIMDIALLLQADRPCKTLDSPGLGWYSVDLNNVLFLNEFYISGVAYQLGHRARSIYECFMQQSTKLYIAFLIRISDTPELLPEKAVECILPQQLLLVFSILKDKSEILDFYMYCHDKIMSFFDHVDKEELRRFISLMDSNYLDHKEMFGPYIEMLLDTIENNDDFEEEWLNEWKSICHETSAAVNSSSQSGDLKVHDSQYPEKWIFLDTCFWGIHNQYHIDLESELNLYYIVLNCLKELKNA